jgi:hypothetical protein
VTRKILSTPLSRRRERVRVRVDIIFSDDFLLACILSPQPLSSQVLDEAEERKFQEVIF